MFVVGAEAAVGPGDALYLPPNTAKCATMMAARVMASKVASRIQEDILNK